MLAEYRAGESSDSRSIPRGLLLFAGYPAHPLL